MTMASSIAYTSTDYSGQFLYQPPTLIGNAILLALFAILIPVSLALGRRYGSLLFSLAVALGLALEVTGYIGRLLLRSDLSSRTDFAVFLAGTTLGPTCICGAIFSVMPRIVAIYGEEYHSWRAVWYLFRFPVLAVGSFALELAGSVILAVQDTPTVIDTGVRLLVAGLAVQLVALAIFVMYGILFSIALRTRQHDSDPEFAPIYTSLLFKTFLFMFTIATILVIIRAAYRTVQIAEGFQSSIAQAEILFLVLDGAVMLAAAILLLVFFPARAFGQFWSETAVLRLSRKPQREIHLISAPLPDSRPNQSPNWMSTKSSISTYSPRNANYSAPSPQREMVDSDNLW